MIRYFYYSGWLLIYLVWVVYGIITRLTVNSYAKKKVKIYRIIHVTLFTGSFVLLLINGDSVFFKIHSGNLTQPSGIVVLYLGCFVAVWARLLLANNWSGRIQILEDQKIIEKGPYRIVRHPIYLGFTLAFAGSFVYRLNFAGLLALVTVMVLYHIKIPQEEKVLITEFKDEYPVYMNKTKKLIPFIY